jgi:Glyoxalase-like domain
MAARIGNIAFDCDDVLKVATFWSAVLGRPLDKGSSELFASIGGADEARREPAWYFEKVPEVGRCGVTTVSDLRLSSV